MCVRQIYRQEIQMHISTHYLNGKKNLCDLLSLVFREQHYENNPRQWPDPNCKHSQPNKLRELHLIQSPEIVYFDCKPYTDLAQKQVKKKKKNPLGLISQWIVLLLTLRFFKLLACLVLSTKQNQNNSCLNSDFVCPSHYDFLFP